MAKPLIIFKASAGSGKTYSLVKEYLKIALSTGDPNYFRHILAITFTNKAAAEMKLRVFEFLNELRKEGTGLQLKDDLVTELGISSDQLKQRSNEMLREIMYNYSDMAICTIDSFVLKIVRGFSKEIGLPYQFDLELDEEKIIDLAIDRVIEDSMDNSEISKVLNDFIEYRISEESSWSFLDDLKSFCKHTLKDKSRKNIEILSGINNEEFDLARAFIMEKRKESKKNALAKAKDLKALINSLGAGLGDFKGGTKSQFYRIEKILTNNQLGDIDTQYENYTLVEGDQWFTKGNDREQIFDPHKSQIRQEFKDLLGHCKSYLTWEVKINSIYPMMLISNVARAIDEIKFEQESLLISDSHRIINEIIRDNPVPFIYERIGERYKHFMIDEFQDTSVTQFHNLIPLIENSVSQDYENIIVGDSKQSIYRFREGESEQIIKLPKELHRKEELSDGDYKEELISRVAQEKELNVNFRSDHEIVNFNNSFFEVIQDRLSLEHDAALQFSGFKQKANSNKQGYVSINEIEKEEFTLEVLELLVKEIRLCLEEGFGLGDISILVRDRNKGEIIANHFAQFPDLPFISQDSLKFRSNKDLLLIINILKQHLNKDHLISGLEILSYLTSRTDKNIHHEAAVTCCYKSNEESYALNRFDIDKCLDLFNIDYKLDLETNYSILETVHKIIIAFNINVNNGFVHQLLDEVHKFSAKNGHHLSGFLELWVEDLNKKSIDIPESKNAIRILSIHKSKGLQFPVVFIPFTSWASRSNKEFIWVEALNDDPLPFYLIHDKENLYSTFYSHEHHLEKGKKLIDNLNLLYVAFTRAKNRLYVYTERKKQQIKELKADPGRWISHFIQNTDRVEFGIKESIPKSKEIQNDQFNFQLKSSEWKEKLAANKNYYEDYMRFEAIKNKKINGILIHRIFEKSSDLETCLKEIKDLRRKMVVNQAQCDILSEKFKSLYSNPEIASVINATGIVKNEMALVDRSGNSYRPDRLIFEDGKVQIIDLKTGGKSDDHHKQLDHYQALLEDIGYSKFEKHLIYFKTEEIVSWN